MSRMNFFFWLFLLGSGMCQESAIPVESPVEFPVESPPFIVQQPSTEEVLFFSGEGFVLPCEATGEPTPSFTWFKDGEEFDLGPTNDRIFLQPGSGSLVVNDTEKEDAGHYQCFASNQFGTATSNSVFVREAEMESFPEVEKATVEYAKIGSPFNLTCSPPHGYPKPEVYWIIKNTYYRPATLKNITDPRITTDPENGTLFFSTITEEDKSKDSFYYCASYSAVSDKFTIGNPVYLGVYPFLIDPATVYDRSPDFLYVTKPHVVALKGGSASLWCIPSGTPLPKVSWIKKGSPLPPGIEYLNYGKTLKINNVDFSDEDRC
ncbi:neuroglian-like [Folsomia candida]|uniref:neuroglian-like n=1 Tax=Folsomia candida TaxID=158441 RepID=UPI0016051641|nr:neuroglian-like [Folsomia candida]